MIRHAVKLIGIGLFAILLDLSSAIPVFAQEPLTTIRSNVIKEIDGREYYIHTIRKGQSLYMIAKAYGVDVNVLIRENPEVKEGIQSGQKLRIPANPGEEAPKKEVKPVIVPEKPKEEPKPQVVPEPPKEQVKKEPVPEIKAEEVPPVPAELTLPEPAQPCGADPSAKKEVYDIALMIPLYLNEMDQMNVTNPTPEAVEEYNPLRFIQFYEGFRLAADSLEGSGAKIRLHVYDAIRDTGNTVRLLGKPEMKKMDLIIGLVYQRDFQVIASFGNKHRIPVVNPLSERDQIVDGNPSVIKVRPPLKSQAPELAAYLAGKYSDANIIIIRDARFKESPEPENLRKACGGKSLSVRMYDGYSKVFEVLSKEKENILIVYSDNKVFALEFLTKMNEFRNEYGITVFGMPRWDELEGLEPEYLVNMKTHMISSSFVDYDDPAAKRFVAGFQERFRTDPDILAFQGYDVAVYFMTALRTFGRSVGQCIPGFSFPILESDYKFLQNPGNGLENQHWEIYKYENYRLTRAE